MEGTRLNPLCCLYATGLLKVLLASFFGGAKMSHVCRRECDRESQRTVTAAEHHALRERVEVR